jgi:hypothetical protein
MDRVARVRHQHDIARGGDCLRDVSETFLGAERGDDLRLGIELHAEAAVVVGSLRTTQSGNSARGRVAVCTRLAECLLELLDHVRGRRQIRIAHAEIDDVRSRVAGLRLGLVHLFENVGRQTANAVEVFHRLKTSKDGCPRQPSHKTPAGFYHGFALAPSVWPFCAPFGGFFAVGAAFLVAAGRPSWRSRTLINSFSSLTCSSSVMGDEARLGGISCTAGYS